MLKLKENGRFYIGDFFIEMPIANINSSPINHPVRYGMHKLLLSISIVPDQFG